MEVNRFRFTVTILSGISHKEQVARFFLKAIADIKKFDLLVNNSLLERKLLADAENVSAGFKAILHPVNAGDEGVALASESTDALNHIVTFFVCPRLREFLMFGASPLNDYRFRFWFRDKSGQEIKWTKWRFLTNFGHF